MDINSRLQISYYEYVSTINDEHRIYLVRHRENGKFFVKKILSVYNIAVYEQLMRCPVVGLPGIICFCEEDNELTLIEEFISGETLENLLSTGGALSEEETIRYTLELLDIVSRLHSLNPPLIHRDIKPSNIMITPDNHVILLDLNAARTNTVKSEDTRLLGTKGYAAPEQYGFGSSGIQTDIYSVGMLMNTMLNGTFSPDIVNSPLAPIIKHCTEMEPSKRYCNTYDLITALNTRKKTPFVTVKKNSLVPPGFRSGNIFHMFIAVCTYLFVIYVSTTAVVENTFGIALWINRATIFLFCTAIIVCVTNYLNVQRLMPLCQSTNRFVRIAGIALLTVLASIVVVMLGLIIEGIANNYTSTS